MSAFGAFATRALGQSTFTPTTTSPASASVSGFSSSNYFQSSTLFDLTPGTAIVCSWFVSSNPTADHMPWSCSRSGRGWYIDVINASNRQVYLNFAGGSTMPLMSSTQLGLCTLAASRKLDGSFRYSLNGVTVGSVASPTYVANDGTSTHYIGRGNSAIATAGFSIGKVLGCAFIAAEASDTELRTWSAQTNATDRYHLHSGVTGHASLTFAWQPDTDWNGSSSTSVAGLGSAPPTFTKTGTLTKNTIEARYIYRENPLWWSDSRKYDTPAGTIANMKDPFARVRATTDATELEVGIDLSITASVIGWVSAECAVNPESSPTYVTKSNLDNGGITRVIDYALPAGAKTIDLWGGIQSTLGGATIKGTEIYELRVPRSTPLFIQPRSSPAHRLLFIGDSIASGDRATNAADSSALARLRKLYPNRIALIGYGFAALDDFTNTSPLIATTAARVAALLDGSVSNTVFWQLGTNDYGLPKSSAATYGTRLAAVIDAVRALKPGAKHVCQKMMTRGTETANGYGSTLGDFRTAMNTVATDPSRSADCTVFDATSVVTYPTNYAADGIHPIEAGHVQWASAIVSYMQVSFPSGGW